MTDKELLELAAKAAGIEIEWKEWVTGRVAEFQTIKYTEHHEFWSNGKVWNPLIDDGDALRLAVKLNLDILQDPMDGHSNNVEVCANDHEAPYSEESGCMCWSSEERGEDPYAATRRAIVRAAAEIGRTL